MNASNEKRKAGIKSVTGLAEIVDYSFIEALTRDPQSTESGDDYHPRQVFSGHYVPVKPTSIAEPICIAHSKVLFEELGFDDELAKDIDFIRLFSGDLSNQPAPIRFTGWATGYALSIYGTEYIQQCPFQTGNGYGDGRAISVFEVNGESSRFEMQLKGAGPTPYCRGADGRAVLRSSVREFLAQEYMHALGVPTSRSLCLIASATDTVYRPWYEDNSRSADPTMMVENPVAISTRVAPSFIRVGQLELFARRARSNQHPEALAELRALVEHLIVREYSEDISADQPLEAKVTHLAVAFRHRLTDLIANWIRVGYCQGNFNSDNCAAGGFTLDYGPFGFCEPFDPFFQPWTGGGRHFSFLNQPVAAQKNFSMFCQSLAPLLSGSKELEQLDEINKSFEAVMQEKLDAMWASKLGLNTVAPEFVIELLKLMMQTPVDYTLFFRGLSSLPVEFSALKESFYKPLSESLEVKWEQWFESWKAQVTRCEDASTVSERMMQVNPKFAWREWLVVPAYEQAAAGDYSLINELQNVFTHPYSEQTSELESKYCKKRPEEYLYAGGVSHYSCSS